MLARPTFGLLQPRTVGAELEMFLITPEGMPMPVNDAVRSAVDDSRIGLEMSRFNLELNLSPAALPGRPFTAFHTEARNALAAITDAATRFGARPLLIGMLPTLLPAHLTSSFLTAAHRYHALDKALARAGHRPFTITVDGRHRDDRYVLRSDSVGVQGAVCSWQIHLVVPPHEYARTYNAAQLAIGPVLAAAGNSAIPFGRDLWCETRIPWYEQGMGDRTGPGPRQRSRVRFGRGWLHGSAQELFTATVRDHPPLLPFVFEQGPSDRPRPGTAPPLNELRLHQSTVYLWNRPVYDPADEGHLRIECRALPSGPTLTDMVANAAALTGLILHLSRTDAPDPAATLPFDDARANFYRAARWGLEANLRWPTEDGRAMNDHRADDLLDKLLPRAADGLLAAHVDGREVRRWLAPLHQRLRTGGTGAAWQRRALAASPGDARATAALVRRYAQLSASDRPVHTWDPPEQGLRHD
ncbi:glutamate--cysteine ligase [Streptomyces huasconensis]|uniref:glutamate--cysteine ligase n=1 Tax=Streptomyces huasconensis TaxID=1854574 RepID=UPI003702C2ED